MAPEVGPPYPPPLVGVGAALFVLVSKYGFGGVLGAGVALDCCASPLRLCRASASSAAR